MSHESAGPQTTFGYLSMLESPEHGYFGGYLIVSLLGRPLEFHCTAPVRPSRAQRILFGPTLEPYLLGEQIAGALLEVATLTPDLMLTNSASASHARLRTGMPMVFLSGSTEPPSGGFPQTDSSSQRLDASSVFRAGSVQPAASLETLTVGSYKFQLPLGHESERDVVTRLLTELAGRVDLAEPFERIEAAIREAQRLGSRGGETHDQAA